MDEALREFQTVLAIKPNSAEAHNNLGALYDRLGRKEEAFEQFQIAVKLKPDFEAARRNLEILSAEIKEIQVQK